MQKRALYLKTCFPDLEEMEREVTEVLKSNPGSVMLCEGCISRFAGKPPSKTVSEHTDCADLLIGTRAEALRREGVAFLLPCFLSRLEEIRGFGFPGCPREPSRLVFLDTGEGVHLPPDLDVEVIRPEPEVLRLNLQKALKSLEIAKMYESVGKMRIRLGHVERLNAGLLALVDFSMQMADCHTLSAWVRRTLDLIAALTGSHQCVVGLMLRSNDEWDVYRLGFEGIVTAEKVTVLPGCLEMRVLERNTHVSQPGETGWVLLDDEGPAVGVALKGKNQDLGVIVSSIPDLDATAPESQRSLEECERAIRLVAAPAALALDNLMQSMRLAQQAITDGMTGLFNHVYFHERLKEEASNAAAKGYGLSLLMIDIDWFKKFNDTHGHLMGDEVIKAIANIIRDNIRERDVAARYGGEELCVILPDTCLRGGMVVAERIRKAVEAFRFPIEDADRYAVTISLGLASCSIQDSDANALLKMSDTALYSAKAKGRNRVEVYAPSCTVS